VLVAAQQHLGVGVARELAAQALELGAQLAEVVDLAVEGEREARGEVAHGLRGADRVDDREAPVAEQHLVSGRGRAEFDAALAVGPAMRHRIEHAAHGLARDPERIADDGAGDAAHGYSAPRGAAPRCASIA
jgi:hypothetical protein